MPSITLTLEADKATRVNAAIQGLWPIPQVPDPEFVGDPKNAPLVNEFTATQWAKIKIIKWLAKTTHRWEYKQALDSITVVEDPEIAT